MADHIPPQLPIPLYLARLIMRLDLLEPPYADPTNPSEQAEAAEVLPESRVWCSRQPFHAQRQARPGPVKVLVRVERLARE